MRVFNGVNQRSLLKEVSIRNVNVAGVFEKKAYELFFIIFMASTIMEQTR